MPFAAIPPSNDASEIINIRQHAPKQSINKTHSYSFYNEISSISDVGLSSSTWWPDGHICGDKVLAAERRSRRRKKKKKKGEEEDDDDVEEDKKSVLCCLVRVKQRNRSCTT